MLARIIAMLDRTIGRCPYCMKTAFRSALLAWAVLAAAVWVWPGSVLAVAVLIGASALTALWLAHVVAYGSRVLALLQAEYRPAPARRGAPARSRREFLWVLGTAAAITASATIWLPATALARGNPCGEGKYCPDDAPKCCSRSQGKCCNGNWACTVNAKCYEHHEDARAACGSGTVWACS